MMWCDIIVTGNCTGLKPVGSQLTSLQWMQNRCNDMPPLQDKSASKMFWYLANQKNTALQKLQKHNKKTRENRKRHKGKAEEDKDTTKLLLRTKHTR